MSAAAETAPVPAPANPGQVGVKLTMLGASSSSPFPMIDRVWEIFSSKGIRTSFLTIGASSSSAPDLDIAEALGCPIHAVPLTEEEGAKWQQVGSILKERKREETNSTFPFSDGAQAKWILPKNLRIQKALPWWAEGTVSVGGQALPTRPVTEVVKEYCDALKLKDGVARIDILKIDTTESAPGLEKAILGAILSAGFRPTIVLVNWSKRPDVDLATTVAAGSFQNCGYRLMASEGTKFLYYYTDDDMYQICSWENTKCANPLMDELVRATREAVASAATGPRTSLEETEEATPQNAKA